MEGGGVAGSHPQTWGSHRGTSTPLSGVTEGVPAAASQGTPNEPQVPPTARSIKTEVLRAETEMLINSFW